MFPMKPSFLVVKGHHRGSRAKAVIVYKYATSSRIDVLKTAQIRFTQANALNDPFEVNPCLVEFMEGAKDYARTVYKGPPLTTEQIEVYARKEASAFLQRLYPDYLILSLSKINDNRLMWSHYAECHRGMVLGFDSTHPFFSEWKPGMTPLMDVDYDETRFVLHRDEDWTTGNVVGMFLRKSSDWIYEEEIRMFARSSVASNVDIAPNGEQLFLFDYPKECLKQLIFGVLADDDFRNKVLQIVREKYPHIRLFQAMLNETDFDLEMVEFSGDDPESQKAGS
jgi:hypothetical protein